MAGDIELSPNLSSLSINLTYREQLWKIPQPMKMHLERKMGSPLGSCLPIMDNPLTAAAKAARETREDDKAAKEASRLGAAKISTWFEKLHPEEAYTPKLAFDVWAGIPFSMEKNLATRLFRAKSIGDAEVVGEVVGGTYDGARAVAMMTVLSLLHR